MPRPACINLTFELIGISRLVDTIVLSRQLANALSQETVYNLCLRR